MIHGWAARSFGTVLRLVGQRARRYFDAETRHAPAVSEALLQRILRRNRDTEFGRRHGLSAIRGAAEFRRALPLAGYEDFRADIDRIAQGEGNVLTADPVVALYLSSGTTGRNKRVPGTRASHGLMSRYVGLVGRGFLIEAVPAARRTGMGLVLIGSGLTEPSEAGLPTGSLSAFLMRGARRMAPFLGPSPSAVYELPSLATGLYLHLLFALRRRDLSFLSAPFLPVVLELLRTLERRGPALLADLARGELNAELELEPAERQQLRARLRADPVRAREIEQCMAQGSEGLALRIWPRLRFVSAIVGGSFSAYVEAARHYLGALPFYSPAFVASEAVIGIGVSARDSHYVMPPGAAFFEFIPAEALDEAEPETCSLEDLELGRHYEVVVTTVAGLYRYRVGDVIGVVGFQNRAPVVEFLYRRGTLLNLAAEKTSEDAAQTALVEALAETEAAMIDYTILPDLASSPPRYIYLIERPRGDAAAVSAGQLAERLEQALRRASPYYGSIRDDGRLGALQVRWVPAGSFHALRERLVERGASATQVKVPRVLRQPDLLSALLPGQDSAAVAAATPTR